MQTLSFVLAISIALSIPVSAFAAEFLFIRHAESTSNVGEAKSPEELKNPPLTDLGRQQARDLVDRLSGRNVIAIYISAYQRTALTIAPTAEYLDLTPNIDPRINEWAAGGVTGTTIDYDAIHATVNAWAEGDPSASLSGGESHNQLVARVSAAYEAIMDMYKNENGVVIIVGHGASIGLVLPLVAENISLPFAIANPMQNAGIIEVELFNNIPYVMDWQGVEVATPVELAPLPAN